MKIEIENLKLDNDKLIAEQKRKDEEHLRY